MRRLVALIVCLSADTAVAAVTHPTGPASVDYRVHAELCTLTISTSAALQNYLNKTAGAGCGGATGPQYGDLINVAPGVTFTDPGSLPVAGGTIANGGLDNWVTIQTNPSGSTCPSAGTRAIDANDPLGRTANVANLATLTSSTTASVLRADSVDNVSHYRFVCIRITGPNISGYPTLVDLQGVPDVNLHYPDSTKYPDHISFERVIVSPPHDFGATAGFRLNGSDVRVVDSNITNIISNFSADANGIHLRCGPGPAEITNNDIGTMGENVFIGGGPQHGCGVIEAGYQYTQFADVPVEDNFIYRLLSWKRDHATYNPQTDLSGTGTVSSSGTTLTFAGGGSCPAVGKWVRGLTSGAAVKISSGSGASCSAMTSPSPAFSAESWRYNTADLAAKNLLETKGGNRVRVRYNLFYQAWKDGQSYDLTMTPREYGWMQDWEVGVNLFLNTPGPNLFSPGDYEGGAGFGASPVASARVWHHDDLWMKVATSALETFTSPYYGGILTTLPGLFGQITTQYTGTIQAGATSGSTTFTAVGDAVFSSDMLGTGSNICIVYNNGTATPILKATITGYTDTKHITGTIATCTGCDTSVHNYRLWAIGKCTLVGTMAYQPDSLIVENSGWAVDPTLTNLTSPWLFQGYQAGFSQNTLTNLVWRSNYAMNGSNTGSSNGGIVSDGTATAGTGVLNQFADNATLTYGNNVLYGPQTLTASNNASQWYTNGPGPNLLKCAGPNSFSSTCKTAFHDSDQAATGAGGGSASMGFTSFPAGGDPSNLRLTGTYATAGHDGGPVGPSDIPTLYRRSAYAYQGTPYGSGGVLAVSGSSGASAVSGSSGRTAGTSCVRGIIAALDSGC